MAPFSGFQTPRRRGPSESADETHLLAAGGFRVVGRLADCEGSWRPRHVPPAVEAPGVIADDTSRDDVMACPETHTESPTAIPTDPEVPRVVPVTSPVSAVLPAAISIVPRVRSMSVEARQVTAVLACGLVVYVFVFALSWTALRSPPVVSGPAVQATPTTVAQACPAPMTMVPVVIAQSPASSGLAMPWPVQATPGIWQSTTGYAVPSAAPLPMTQYPNTGYPPVESNIPEAGPFYTREGHRPPEGPAGISGEEPVSKSVARLDGTIEEFRRE